MPTVLDDRAIAVEKDRRYGAWFGHVVSPEAALSSVD
jgi:hypothetical protein